MYLLTCLCPVKLSFSSLGAGSLLEAAVVRPMQRRKSLQQAPVSCLAHPLAARSYVPGRVLDRSRVVVAGLSASMSSVKIGLFLFRGAKSCAESPSVRLGRSECTDRIFRMFLKRAM